MKFKIPIEVRKNGIFHDLLFLKSDKYKIAIDTGSYFCMSAITPTDTIGDADIPYLLAGDKETAKIASWDVDLVSKEDIIIPSMLMGLYIPRNPKSEENYWDFLVGMNFLYNKSLHLDFNLGELKEGWLEIEYEK